MGECKTKHEVETFLNSSKSKTEKTRIAKLHIQLIKDTYDLTDLQNRKELVKVTKSTEVLARDLCTLVEFVHQPTPEVNDQNDTAEYTESAVDITHIKDQIRDQLVSVGVGGRKSQDVSARRLAADETTRNEKPTQPRERDEESDEEESEDDLQDESSESEDDMEDESTESDDDDAAEMETDGKADLKVGDIVVAAWEDTWYPGEIIHVQGTNQHDQVIVSYMQRLQGNQNRFSWPPKNKLDIQPTLIAAIIHRDIILTPGESLRYVCIEKDMLVTLNKNIINTTTVDSSVNSAVKAGTMDYDTLNKENNIHIAL
ncbi:uncharacterized protein [Amphiura filiformis]|uniref:uncharacterized protein n=1 Tax=Amphiura filiformis TaxID=82378 RepID=UPI003B2110D7